MHAIIPVAGKGTRMRPHTWSVPKVLMTVAGKTMLGHIIDGLRASGVDRLTLVVGYLGDEIVEWTKEEYPDMTLDWEFQERMDGLASAVMLASSSVDDGPTLVVLGDTIFRGDLSPAFDPEMNMIAVRRVEDPSRFGVVVLDGDRVTKLVEKPSDFVSDLAIVGIYGFRSGRSLIDATTRLISSGRRTRGEFQLTDAMQMMLEEGAPFGVFEIEGWYDCGKHETMLDTNRRLLDLSEGTPSPDCPASCIVQPVSIAPGTEIVSSVIGPHVSLDRGCRIENSVIRNSIIGSGTVIRNATLLDSIIGREAEITGRAASIRAGSSCRIEL